jgi:hypothetical protein
LLGSMSCYIGMVSGNHFYGAMAMRRWHGFMYHLPMQVTPQVACDMTNDI